MNSMQATYITVPTLYTPIPTHPTYEISEEGVVVATETNSVVEVVSNNDGIPCVILPGKDGRVMVSIALLMIRTYRAIEERPLFPIKIFYKDLDNTNYRLSNLTATVDMDTYRTWGKDKTYKHIPGFSKYVINTQGKILNSLTTDEIQSPLTKEGYRGIAHLTDDNGERKRNILLHFLLAKAYIPIPDKYKYDRSVNVLDLLVYFKDCDRTNYFIDQVNPYRSNISWYTRLERAELLRNHKRLGSPLKIIDEVVNETIIYHEDVQAALRHRGVSDEVISELETDPIGVYERLTDIDYVIVPEFTEYALNRQGVVRKMLNGEIVKPLPTPLGQYRVNLTYILADGTTSRTGRIIANIMVSTFLREKTVGYKPRAPYTKDGNVGNYRLDNIVTDQTTHTDRVVEQPGYKTIPGYSRYAISQYGDIVIKATNRKLKASNSHGYLSCGLISDEGPTHMIAVHRCTALMYVPIPEGQDARDLEVHHKDGNKKNNFGSADPEATNLEWLTPAEHRRETELLGQVNRVGVKVKDCIKGEILFYPNMVAASRVSGVDPATLYRYLRDKKDLLVKGKYQFKYGDDNTEWGDPTGDQIQIRAIRVIDVSTKEVTVHPTMAAAGEFVGISKSTVYTRLNNPAQIGIPCYGFKFEYADTPQATKVIKEEYTPSTHIPYNDTVDAVPSGKGIGVKARDYKTGEILQFPSLSAASVSCGQDITTLLRYLRDGKSLLSSEGYQFKYSTDSSPWIEPTGTQIQIKKVRVRDVYSGMISEYDTLSAASVATGLVKSTVHKRLNDPTVQGTPCKGYIFEYITGDNIATTQIDKYIKPTEKSSALRPIRVYNLTTKEETQYDTVQAAAIKLGIARDVILKRLRPQLANMPHNGYLFRYTTDMTPWPDKLIVKEVKQQKQVKVKDLDTGMITVHKNARVVGKLTGAQTTQVYDRLKNPKLYNVPLNNRYLVKYADNDSIWNVDYRPLPVPIPTKLKCTNEYTGEILRFPTFTAINKAWGIDHKSVMSRLSNKVTDPYKGTWKIERDID